MDHILAYVVFNHKIKTNPEYWTKTGGTITWICSAFSNCNRFTFRKDIKRSKTDPWFKI